MKFKRTKTIERLEKELNTGIYKTGRYVYFKHTPGGELCRMSHKDYSEYLKIRHQGSGERFFWAHAEFAERKITPW